MIADTSASSFPSKREIFLGALDITSSTERAEFLARECKGDASLRAAVEELLHEALEVDNFLESPAVAVDPKSGVKSLSPTGTEALFTEKPGDRIGNYKLLQKLGEGGCGVVYMAEQEKPLRRRVALKIIKLGMDTRQVIARFEAERQALALMDHPSIAKVLDAGATDTGRPFFVMELVRGIKISEYCDQANLPTADRLRLFIQVCNAIQHAHQKSIVHRDIKPSNILVTLHDGIPLPKVIDFGVAKATNQQRLTDLTVFTAFDQFIGTPAYMSPEQAEMSGLDVDTRSDIYSLGVLLYELLTGKTPFDAEALARGGLDECRRTIRLTEPVRPSNRLATMIEADLSNVAHRRGTESPRLIHLLRGDLDWIVMKCLEKDRARRYATANALTVDVQHYLRGEAVEARPPTARYRAQKFARRHRGPLAATAALVLVLVAGAILSTWQAIRAKRAEEVARGLQSKEALLRRQAENGWQRAREKGELAKLNEYVADISLAQQALHAGNFGRASQLLEKHTPQNGEKDLRGFEWRYLWQLCRGDNHVALPDQDGSVQDLAFSPQGEWLAVALRDKVNIYETRNHLLLATLPGMFASIAFSPDGKFLYTTAQARGRPRPDEAASTGIRVWTTGNWKETTSLPRASGPALAVSGDGGMLACQSRGAVQLWRTADHQQAGGLESASIPLAFSPDGKVLATDSSAGITLWNVETLQTTVVLENSTNIVVRGGPWFIPGHALVFSPDGQQLIAARNFRSDGAPFVLVIWDAHSGKMLDSMPQNPEHIEHTGFITSIALSPDGSSLATASMDHSIKIWDVATRRARSTLHGHLSEAWAVAFSPDGQTVATGGKDGSVKLWPAHVARKTDSIDEPLQPVALSKNSRTLAALDSRNSSLVFLNLATREIERELKLEDPRFLFFGSVPVNADLSIVAEAQRDGRVKLTNPSTGEANYLKVSDHPVGFVSLSPDGRELITGGFGQRLRWWRLSDNSSITLESDAYRAVFSPKGDTLALVGKSNVIELWDAPTRTPRVKISLESNPGFAIAFSPDGHTLASASFPDDPDQSVYLWDARSGKPLGHCAGHKQAVFAVAFSPDGRTLATASDDSTIKLWNVATQQELVTISRPGGGSRALLFSSDGRLLIASGSPNTQFGGFQFFRAPLLEEIAPSTTRPR